jgi:hypothetical protein
MRGTELPHLETGCHDSLTHVLGLQDAAFCSSCTSWHPAADFSAACHTCRSCQLDQTERMVSSRTRLLEWG